MAWAEEDDNRADRPREEEEDVQEAEGPWEGGLSALRATVVPEGTVVEEDAWVSWAVAQRVLSIWDGQERGREGRDEEGGEAGEERKLWEATPSG